MKDRPPGALDSLDSLHVIQALAAIGKAEARSGRREEARATLRQALELLGKLQPVPLAGRISVLTSIATAQAEMGDMAEAMKTIDGAPVSFDLQMAIDRVARALEEQGDREGARKFRRRQLLVAEEACRNPKPSLNQTTCLVLIAENRARLGERSRERGVREVNEQLERRLFDRQDPGRVRRRRRARWPASSLAEPWARRSALSVAEGNVAKPR